MIRNALDDPSQRENHFHSKCLIKESVYSLVIDSGSCQNVDSSSMVNLLKLPTYKNSTQYKLQWLNECGELKVQFQVLIKSKIRNYHDEALCDVIPMQAFYFILGRP